MALFAGIDIGTSSLKVLVVNEIGKIIATSQVAYSIVIEKVGYAEQNPLDWCEALNQALNKIKSQCDMSEILSIGFSGQMHGLVAVDTHHRPIRPAIIWMDQRTDNECNEIKKRAGENMIKQSLLNSPAPGMLICSLLWLKKREPDNYKKIYKLMSPKDFVRLYITGVVATDETDASATLAFSVKHRTWETRLLDQLGIKSEIFPTVGQSCDSGGRIKRSLAEQFGFNRDVYIALGGGDSAMQLIGNGVIDSSVLTVNIGTASQIASVLNTPIYDHQMRLQTWCHGIANTWYIQGGSLNGGGALTWIKTNIFKKQISFKEMDELASRVVRGSEGLICLPHLAGERSPYANSHARGSFVGLTMKHSIDEMIRAMMEGVVYNLKGSFDILKSMGIENDFVISSGGGAKGNCWKQIQADILEMAVCTTEFDEEAALGAAISGAVGQGAFKDIASACNHLVSMSDQVVLPIKEHVEYYKNSYHKFCKLYEKIDEVGY